MSNYQGLFEEAVRRTARVGAVAPSVTYAAGRNYLSQEAYDRFPYYVQKAIGDLDFPDVVAQCLSIHYRLKEPLEEFFGCNVFYTIGWVEHQTGRNMLEFDEHYAEQLLVKKHRPGGTVNMHAWLTLPSMEIIDVALATSIGFAQDRPEMYGAVVAKHADELTGGMAYRPMLVGEDYLLKTGLAKVV